MECHVCHYINYNLTLADRTWTCPSCHTVHDRDENSAAIIDNKKSIRQELPEFTLGETGSMDDIVSIAYALKSIPPLNQEAPPERNG